MSLWRDVFAILRRQSYLLCLPICALYYVLRLPPFDRQAERETP